MEKKNKKSLIFLILLLVVSITIGGTIAFFSSRDTFSNEFNAGTYVIQTQERFESPDDWTPGTTTDKEVIVTNRGTTPAAVRVKLTESWKDTNGNPLPLKDGNNNPAGIINYAFDKDFKWEKVGDWYYYFRSVDQNQSTSSLIESVTFNPNVAITSTKNCVTDETTHATTCTTETNDYGGGTYTLVVDIETCQYDKYQEIWNTNVEISTPNTILTGTLKAINTDYGNNVFGKKIDKYNFESVYILDIIRIPAEAIDSWDASVEQNGSIMAWYTDLDENGKYELYIGQEGGVKANPDSSHAFSHFEKSRYNNFKYLDTSNVTNMKEMFYNTGYVMASCDSFVITGMESWDTSKVENMNGTFRYVGRSCTNWTFGDISGWDTSSVTNMSYMFERAGFSANKFDIDVSNWNVSNVEDMGFMFDSAGYDSKYWSIGDLSNWDTSKVTNMYQMFPEAGRHADTWNSIGTLKIYANNIHRLFSLDQNAKATLNIYSNPTSYSSAFTNAATVSGSGITVNYVSTTANIDNIIATKSSDSNVVKGVQLD